MRGWTQRRVRRVKKARGAPSRTACEFLKSISAWPSTEQREELQILQNRKNDEEPDHDKRQNRLKCQRGSHDVEKGGRVVLGGAEGRKCDGKKRMKVEKNGNRRKS